MLKQLLIFAIGISFLFTRLQLEHSPTQEVIIQAIASQLPENNSDFSKDFRR